MLGYLNDEQATSSRIINGRLHTGDLGCFDDNGNLIITGRKSSMLVFSSSFKCIPEAVESKINALPFVEESLLGCSSDCSHAILTIVSEVPERVDKALVKAVMCMQVYLCMK